MSSIKCQSCGLVNFANAEKCKRCKKPLAAGSKDSLPLKEPFLPYQTPPPDALKKTSSDMKTLLKLLPIVIFGVPLVLVIKDRIFDPPAISGGHVDTLQMSILVGCTIGLIITAIVLVLTRSK